MADSPSNRTDRDGATSAEVKLLPGVTALATVHPSPSAAAPGSPAAAPGSPGAAPASAGASASAAERPSAEPRATSSTASPTRQLADLPRDELEHLAEEFGIDPTRYKDRPALVAAIHDRRHLIAGLDRDAMLDVIRWGRRPVTRNASKEQIATEIARVRTMRFDGLSHRGLIVLARMRGIEALDVNPVPILIKKLKKQEGLFARLSRKRRSFIATAVARIVGEDESATDYKFLPQGDLPGSGSEPNSIKKEIEEAGLLGGITNRLKKSADSYVNQKLDEIEARIDRKLDEIDRRLAEWRDKEIANRIRILKITLWASVIVALFSLIYSYVKVYFVR